MLPEIIISIINFSIEIRREIVTNMCGLVRFCYYVRFVIRIMPIAFETKVARYNFGMVRLEGADWIKLYKFAACNLFFITINI